jgi:hypothetical protein
VLLLQESEIDVVQCQSAEEALRVLEKMCGRVSMMFTDVNLAVNSRISPGKTTPTSASS